MPSGKGHLNFPPQTSTELLTACAKTITHHYMDGCSNASAPIVLACSAPIDCKKRWHEDAPLWAIPMPGNNAGEAARTQLAYTYPPTESAPQFKRTTTQHD